MLEREKLLRFGNSSTHSIHAAKARTPKQSEQMYAIEPTVIIFWEAKP